MKRRLLRIVSFLLALTIPFVSFASQVRPENENNAYGYTWYFDKTDAGEDRVTIINDETKDVETITTKNDVTGKKYFLIENEDQKTIVKRNVNVIEVISETGKIIQSIKVEDIKGLSYALSETTNIIASDFDWGPLQGPYYGNLHTDIGTVTVIAAILASAASLNVTSTLISIAGG